MLPFVKEMVIDQDGKHTITNFKYGKRTSKSDHTTMWMKVNLKITQEKTEKVEILNFKDEKAQVRFKEVTTNTSEFSDCFKSNLSSKDKMINWKHILEKHCKASFPTIRIRKKTLKPSQADQLINERNKLLKIPNEDNIVKINNLSVIIADTIAKEERAKCHMMKKFCNQNGSANLTEMWKLKKKLWPKAPSSLPAAKINHLGKLVSTAADIKKTMIKEYKERLGPRPLQPMMKKHFKNKSISLKLILAKENKSPDFSMKELETVLKSTKTGKARDPEGMVREIFKPNVIGDNMKVSLLYMLNLVKEEGEFPIFKRRANISTIPKKTKSRFHLKNERGIFLVNIIRGIFMKILYRRKVNLLDSNMSDSIVGGRKDKSSINHIWVLNGIIHEQLSSIKKTANCHTAV